MKSPVDEILDEVEQQNSGQTANRERHPRLIQEAEAAAGGSGGGHQRTDAEDDRLDDRTDGEQQRVASPAALDRRRQWALRAEGFPHGDSQKCANEENP